MNKEIVKKISEKNLRDIDEHMKKNILLCHTCHDGGNMTTINDTDTQRILDEIDNDTDVDCNYDELRSPNTDPAESKFNSSFNTNGNNSQVNNDCTKSPNFKERNKSTNGTQANNSIHKNDNSKMSPANLFNFKYCEKHCAKCLALCCANCFEVYHNEKCCQEFNDHENQNIDKKT